MSISPKMATVGWYGKIPALGDFASRRLAPDFIGTWDTWLQQSIVESRASLGARWLQTYLTCPVWHFVLFPGVIGPSAWTGLIMPSLDKVGRHFPLTMALALNECQGLTTYLLALRDWHADVEEVALATLNVDFLPEELEAALSTCRQPDWETGAYEVLAQGLADWWQGDVQEASLILDASQSPNDLLTATGHKLLDSGGHGRSLWWNGTLNSGPQILRGFFGLPPAHCFADLLIGN